MSPWLAMAGLEVLLDADSCAVVFGSNVLGCNGRLIL